MNGRYGEPIYIFSLLPIRGGYNWLSVLPGARSQEPAALPVQVLQEKKNLDKQSYCRNLPQSPSDHKLKLAAKYSSSFDYWLLDGHVCLWVSPEFLHT